MYAHAGRSMQRIDHDNKESNDGMDYGPVDMVPYYSEANESNKVLWSD